MTSSPFKFLDSYTRADIGDFFGREKETDELFRQCFLSPILVVYGGSGTGKTSLVQCGLSSRFQDSDWLAVPVRRSGDMFASVREAIHAVTLTPSNSTDLGQLAANLYLDHFKPIYFLFDQFEELFIFGGHAESEAFFAAMRGLLEKERNAHVLFVVREEYLAELTRYESIIPGLIENRYRVERLTQRHAMEVVEKLCGAHKIPCAEGFSAALVGRLDPEGQGIELSYLQVFLDRCWRTRQGDEPFSPALLERIGHVDDMLGAFLDEQVADTPEPQRSESLLKTFVSDQGTKRQLTSTEAHDWVQTIGGSMELAEVERLLQVFVAKRLLKDRDERGRYELLHDALARQIFQRITRAEQELIEVRQFVQQAHGQFQKRGVKLTANDLTYLRPYRNQLHLKGEVKEFVEGAFGEEERKERRKRIRRNIGVAALLAILVGTGIYTWQLNQRLHAEKLVKQSVDLAEQAMKTLSGDPFTAYLMAEKAFEISPTFESEKGLVTIYPFLYPEIARYRGNGFRRLPYSKAILIRDDQNESISLYDSTGTLRWKRTVAGLRSFSGCSVLDTIGLVVSIGDRVTVQRVTGEILLDRQVPDKTALISTSRELLLSTGSWLMHIDSSARVDTTLLDSAGVHRCLVGLTEFEQHPSMRYIVVKTDSAIQVFDSRSKDFSLLYRWVAPAPLRSEMLIPKEGQCVVYADDALYHLDWNTSEGLRVLTKVDFKKEGISLADGEPKFNFNRAQGQWVWFRTSPAKVYDAELRTLLTLQGLGRGLNDMLYGYSVHSKHFVFWTNGGSAGRDPITISSFDGSWSRTIAPHASWTDAKMITGEKFILRSYSDDREESRITCFALSGDTLWSHAIRSTKHGTQTGYFSQRTEENEFSCLEDVPIPTLQNPGLFGTMDSEGRIQRFLIPLAKHGDFIEAVNDGTGRALVIYADSLVGLLESPLSLPTATAMVGHQWMQCDGDQVPYEVYLRGGKLEGFWATGDSINETFSIDLHGCLDTISVKGYLAGNTCSAMNRKWAQVGKHDDNRPKGVGYLVDLFSRAVVDTGSFEQPATYEFLPEGRGFARIGRKSIVVFDTLLHPIKIINHPMTRGVRAFKRTGEFLFGMDSLKNGVLYIVDLRSLTMNRRVLPTAMLGSDVLSNLDFGPHEDYVWMDDQDVIYLQFKKSRNRRIVAIGPDGYAAMPETKSRYVSVRLDNPMMRHALIVQSYPLVYQTTNTAFYTGGSAALPFEYNARTHTFHQVESQPTDAPAMKMKNGQQTIERSGKVIWDLGKSEGTLCGDYLYSRFRAVDRFERFPLFGKEVIRLVREEKQFGEFWTHINAEPLINKVLGTDAYNTGYSIGSLLRSTWVKLGLLLGSGALAFAWWSRRRRPRAA